MFLFHFVFMFQMFLSCLLVCLLSNLTFATDLNHLRYILHIWHVLKNKALLNETKNNALVTNTVTFMLKNWGFFFGGGYCCCQVRGVLQTHLALLEMYNSSVPKSVRTMSHHKTSML